MPPNTLSSTITTTISTRPSPPPARAPPGNGMRIPPPPRPPPAPPPPPPRPPRTRLVSRRALGLKPQMSPRFGGIQVARAGRPRLASLMISAQQLEVRAGARLLMHDVSFRIGPGDKVGLVGRNGAGKTTLTRILAGEGVPASGQVTSTGSVGYLPQDPRTGDPDVPVRERILSARGLGDVVRRLRDAEHEMGSDDPAVRERGMKRYE